jgi:hypothetical protein
MRPWCSPAQHSSLASPSMRQAQDMRQCQVRHTASQAVWVYAQELCRRRRLQSPMQYSLPVAHTTSHCHDQLPRLHPSPSTYVTPAGHPLGRKVLFDENDDDLYELAHSTRKAQPYCVIPNLPCSNSFTPPPCRSPPVAHPRSIASALMCWFISHQTAHAKPDLSMLYFTLPAPCPKKTPPTPCRPPTRSQGALRWKR